MEQWSCQYVIAAAEYARVVDDHYVWLGADRTRAFREWRLLRSLHAAGLPVPSPVAAHVYRTGVIYTADIITTYVNFEEIPVIRERALGALARHGRSRADFPLVVYTTVRLDDDVATAQRVTTEFLATYYGGGVHERGAMGLGPAAVVIDVMARYAAVGVTDLCIRFIGNDQLAQLDRFTTEVLPAIAHRLPSGERAG